MGEVVESIEVLGGKPVIKGTRIPVDLLLELLASGMSIKEILQEYPELSEESIKTALEFSSRLLKMGVIELVPP